MLLSTVKEQQAWLCPAKSPLFPATVPRPSAFQVRTTAPKVYCVRPASGVLEPGAQAECVVKRSAPSALPAKGEKCKVQRAGV